MIDMVNEEHHPLWSSRIIGMQFTCIRWIILSGVSIIVFKLLSDSIEARIQAWYYDNFEPAFRPIHDMQRNAFERITGKETGEKTEKIQLLLHLRGFTPKMLPSIPFLFIGQKPDPEAPLNQISTVDEYRVKTIDLIYALESRVVPNLGRFMFIHATNNILLLLALLLSTNLLSNPFRNTSIIIVTLVWMVLPVFEINEYDKILSQDIAVASFYFHIIGVSVIAGAVFAMGDVHHIAVPYLNYEFDIPFTGQLAQVVLMTLITATVWMFSSLLERELLQIMES